MLLQTNEERAVVDAIRRWGVEDTVDNRFLLGISALKRGQWDIGWKLLEYRYLVDESRNLSTITCAVTGRKVPHWAEGPPPETLMVIGEQGVGDSIHYLRWVKHLRDQGVNVLYADVTPMKNIQHYMGQERNFTNRLDGVDLRGVDAWIRVMSLPARTGFTPDPDQTYFMRDRCRTVDEISGKFSIGVCWKGNPKHPKDGERSAALSDFEELLRHLDGNFVALPDAISPDEARHIAHYGGYRADCHYKQGDIAPLLDVIGNLDLVVTVDSASAHVAGALGVPSVLLLHEPEPDWRWGDRCHPIRWYPKMTVMRQSVAGDWVGLMSAVTAHVASLAERTPSK